MALSIASFFITLNQSGFTSRNFTFQTPDFSLLIPNEKDVFVEKISVNAIYNGQGNNIIDYYSLRFFIINTGIQTGFQNNIPNNQFKIINPITNQINFTDINYNINSNQPTIYINEKIFGLRFNNSITTGASGSSLIFNSSGSALNNSVSFIVSIYYKP
jgi:hypothetical protein